MNVCRCMSLPALAGRSGLLSLVLLVACALMSTASAQGAAGPATVTVRVEGFNGVTLLPQTSVTTSTTPIPVEGGSCSGTSAGGALYDATHGDWQVKNEAEGVGIFGIEGVDLPPFGSSDYAYWALWVNNEFATSGACAEELGPNANVVFVGQCFALGPECPTSATAPEHFLTATPPTSSIAGVGEPVSLTIGSLNTENGASQALPEGVTVTGGPVPVVPNAQGVATLSFPSAGTYTLQARAADSVPSGPYTICVHNGNDGTCGTQASGAQPPASTALTSAANAGPYVVVAKATGVIEGHTYKRGDAPRVLQGTVDLHTALQDVKLRLTRTRGRKCSYYDGVTERFRAMRCGAVHGVYFSVGSKTSFSYLLPAALTPGRYVLDIEATDTAGEHTTLARGTSRIVFYVK
jgi:hypothetical protein